MSALFSHHYRFFNFLNSNPGHPGPFGQFRTITEPFGTKVRAFLRKCVFRSREGLREVYYAEGVSLLTGDTTTVDPHLLFLFALRTMGYRRRVSLELSLPRLAPRSYERRSSAESSTPHPTRSATKTMSTPESEHTRYHHIGVKTALKRLLHPDFQVFGPADRRVAWEVIMAEGSVQQRKAAHDARDKYPFNA